MENEIKVGDTVIMPLDVIRAYETNVTLKMPDNRGQICVTRDAIAAWNARAGGYVAEPKAYDVQFDNGGSVLTRDYKRMNLRLPSIKSVTALYDHPAPAIDAAEVERLVDALVNAAESQGMYLAHPGYSSNEDNVTAARAALLEYVSKGGE